MTFRNITAIGHIEFMAVVFYLRGPEGRASDMAVRFFIKVPPVSPRDQVPGRITGESLTVRDGGGTRQVISTLIAVDIRIPYSYGLPVICP
jgi:hypothetical protein